MSCLPLRPKNMPAPNASTAASSPTMSPFFISFSCVSERQAGRNPCRRLRHEGLVGQSAQKIYDPIDLGVRELWFRDVPVQIELHALRHRVASSLVVELDGVAK